MTKPNGNNNSAANVTYADVARHFDRIAPDYEDGCGKVGWVGPEVLFDELKPYIPKQASLSLIDLGAGTGRVGQLFKHFHAATHVTGVDISENMLEIARQKSRIDISLVGDVTALPPEAARSFDIVTSAGVLDFIGNTDKLLSEAARVLKQGGLCGIIFEPDNAAGPGHKTISHNEDILKSQFAAHGFSVKKILRAPGIYTNFKTGAAVENVIMIASLDKV